MTAFAITLLLNSNYDTQRLAGLDCRLHAAPGRTRLPAATLRGSLAALLRDEQLYVGVETESMLLYSLSPDLILIRGRVPSSQETLA